MEERNFCIEDPAWCVAGLTEAIGFDGWLRLIGLVGRAIIFAGSL